MTYGYLTGTNIGDDLGNPIGTEARVAIGERKLGKLFLQALHTAHARTPNHTHARLVDVVVGDAGIAQRLVDGNKTIHGIAV